MLRNRMRCFILAQTEELFEFDSFLKDKKFVIKNNQKFFYLNEKNILVISGIGKVNASLTVMNAIASFELKSILNIGLCGSCDPDTTIKQIVLVSNYYFLDVDVKEFGYEYGQIPKMNQFYSSSLIFNEFITRVLNRHEYFNLKALNIGTSDSFINKDKYAILNNFFKNKISLIDMESSAIAQVCFVNHTKFSSIKIISDHINLPHLDNNFQYDQNLIDCSKTINNIISILIENNF